MWRLIFRCKIVLIVWRYYGVTTYRDDKWRSSCNDFSRDLRERTILDRHDLKLRAQRQLKGKSLIKKVKMKIKLIFNHNMLNTFSTCLQVNQIVYLTIKILVKRE